MQQQLQMQQLQYQLQLQQQQKERVMNCFIEATTGSGPYLDMGLVSNIIAYTWANRGLPQLFVEIMPALPLDNPLVCFKFLCLFHQLLLEGHQSVH